MDKISIENREIGEGQPCFVIAEVGVNHNGDPELAMKMVEAAAHAGADCVKFQTFRAQEFVNDAKEWIGEKGYDPVYGARPLKRFLQKQVETRLARAIIAGDLAEGSKVRFSVNADALEMEIVPQ